MTAWIKFQLLLFITIVDHSDVEVLVRFIAFVL